VNQPKWSLYLDDERTPKTLRGWIIARSVAEAKKLISERGFPDYISFDHDLGENSPTGYDFAKWIVNSSLDGLIQLPEAFAYNVHSANPIGAQNIDSILSSYLKFRAQTS
jgi:hypothetical protein